jgi:hypothetical protein
VSNVSECGSSLIKYTLFADASRYGTPPIKALFYEFPDEPELFAVDKQFMIGNALLVTPVLHPNVTTVQGLKASGSSFPAHAQCNDRSFPWYRIRRMA